MILNETMSPYAEALAVIRSFVELERLRSGPPGDWGAVMSNTMERAKKLLPPDTTGSAT